MSVVATLVTRGDVGQTFGKGEKKDCSGGGVGVQEGVRRGKEKCSNHKIDVSCRVLGKWGGGEGRGEQGRWLYLETQQQRILLISR